MLLAPGSCGNVSEDRIWRFASPARPVDQKVILVRSGRCREIELMARTGWVATGDTSVEFQSLTLLFRCVPTVKTSDEIRSAVGPDQ
eukprot:2624900-Rhodomonas_salina.1